MPYAVGYLLTLLLLVHSWCQLCAADTGFYPVGDTCSFSEGRHELSVGTPIVFYRNSYSSLFANRVGVVSFAQVFNRQNFNGSGLPFRVTDDNVPFLAPLWSTYPSSNGSVCFWSTSNDTLLQRFVEESTAGVSELTRFQPSVLALVTWMDPVRGLSFQAVLATDGTQSFSKFIYGHINPGIAYTVGFNKGDSITGIAIGSTNTSLNVTTITSPATISTNVYRIDGNCMTALASSCPLTFYATCRESSDLSAQSCHCSTGYENTTGICVDINECLNPLACPNNSECQNTMGNYRCLCEPGFYSGMVNTSVACTDIDECAIDIHDCDINANCTNTVGSFNCTCKDDYAGDGTTCREGGTLNMNCTEGSPNCLCADTGGSRACYCTPGYQINADLRTCVDINECANGVAVCNNVSFCFNTPGSYYCSCYRGYTTAPDGVTCVDINECATSSSHNCHSNADCLNSNGSHTCRCSDGYTGNGTHCMLGAPCSEGTHSCHICVQSPHNSFTCLCPPGFTLSPNGVSCQDVDECVLRIDNCHGDASCANTNGSFTCTCGNGFYGNGVTCVDVDECANGFDNCSSSKTCNNTLGSFFCTCPNGQIFDSSVQLCKTFAPTIRIENVTRPVGQHIYPIGSSICFEGSNDTMVTVTIYCEEEGTAFPQASTTWEYSIRDLGLIYLLPDSSFNVLAVVNGTRLILGPLSLSWFNIGRFHAVLCRIGNTVATDLKSSGLSRCGPEECDLGVSNNCTYSCSRNGTHHQCTCKDGYEWSEKDINCQDVNECVEDTHSCDLNSTVCRNTNGSYECDCLPGYSRRTIFQCEDINECESNNGGCNETCINFEGSYSCACPSGYQLQSNNRTCADVDECVLNTYNCSSKEQCENIEGSHRCCLDGYYYNSTIGDCLDLDECNNGTQVCGSDQICQNRNGSFDCIRICGVFEVQNGNECQVSAAGVGGFLAAAFTVVIIALVITIIVLFILRESRSHLSSDVVKVNEGAEEDWGEMKDMLYIPPYKLVVDAKIIGQGEFGEVHRATYNNEEVAIKYLSTFAFDISSITDEIKKMKEFNHKNVLNLKGVTSDRFHRPGIVMPFMRHGSLEQYLSREQNRNIYLLEDENSTDIDQLNKASAKLLDFCRQVAEGMSYLSSHNFIHRDLAARNCLLDYDKTIKVSDFGLGVTLDEDHLYQRLTDPTKEKLPLKWLAIECLKEMKFSEASDVWAFGITCWEIFNGGRKPYPSIKSRELLQEKLEEGYRMECPKNQACFEKIYNMTMLNCWKRNPEERPSFTSLTKDISDYMEEFVDYLPLQ